jgi:hypothetical protein
LHESVRDGYNLFFYEKNKRKLRRKEKKKREFFSFFLFVRLLAFYTQRERERDMQQTLQQIIDERISFLKEQINPQNKSEENRTFQLQIDAIRSASAAD